MARRGLLAVLSEGPFHVVETPVGDFADVDVLIRASGGSTLYEPPDDVAIVTIVEDLSAVEYRNAIQSGSHGIVHADQPISTLMRVVEAARSGEMLLPRQVVVSLVGGERKGGVELTSSEGELLSALSSGTSLAEYARSKFLGERTAQRSLQNACLKLGAQNRSEAIKMATLLGMIE